MSPPPLGAAAPEVNAEFAAARTRDERRMRRRFEAVVAAAVSGDLSVSAAVAQLATIYAARRQ